MTLSPKKTDRKMLKKKFKELKGKDDANEENE